MSDNMDYNLMDMILGMFTPGLSKGVYESDFFQNSYNEGLAGQLGIVTGGLGKLSNEAASNAHSLIDSLIAENDINNIRNEFNKVSGNPGIGHYRK